VKFQYFIGLLLISFLKTEAQPAVLNVQKIGLENYHIVYSNYYDGNSLWGYMDGGADLYLEYGFTGLLVEEINYKGAVIKCEIYKMKDSLAAFGIFSIQRHKCKFSPEIKGSHCINNYQVQLAQGNYYISLINQTGDLSVQQISLEIASKFSNSIGEKEIQIPDIQNFRLKNQQLIFINGKIALGNVYPQALNYLENISDFSMWMLPADNKKEPVISLITFENSSQQAEYTQLAFPGIQFEKSARVKLNKGGYRMAQKLNDHLVLQAEGKIGKELKKMFETSE